MTSKGTGMKDYTMRATVAMPYDATVARVRDLIAAAGFGVLTEIDLQATLRAKIGVETPPRVILGACRPQLAHQALTIDPGVATLLPCNVVVAAVDEHTATVEVLDPAVMTSFDDRLAEVAGEARDRLSAMMKTLTSDPEDPDAARA